MLLNGKRGAGSPARRAARLLAVLCLGLAMCLSACSKTKGNSSVVKFKKAGASLNVERQAGVRLLVDLAVASPASEDEIREGVADILKKAAQAGGAADIYPEYVPASGEERREALEKLRGDIMGGTGPDIYICACPVENLNGETALFSLPRQVMESGVFKDLSGLVESAAYMDMTSLTPSVTAAGVYDGGRYILPLSYTFRAAVFDRSEITMPETPLTWNEAVNTGNPILYAACNTESGERFGDILPEPALTGDGKLSFTEEELLSITQRSAALWRQGRGNRQTGKAEIVNTAFGVPEHAGCDFGLENLEYFVDMAGSGQAAIIPAYNTSGGVTAGITAWAAIDANTRREKDAFAVLDVLLGKEGLQSGLFACLPGMPVGEDIGQKNYPFAGDIFFSPENYAEYSRVRSQINSVRFFTEADGELAKMYADCLELENDQMKKRVAQSYNAIRDMLK